MMKIKPFETELKGGWTFSGSKVELDNVSKRIDLLISNYLIEVGVDDSGWNKLYKDPENNRYWELNYPESELHGGGAPQLKSVSQEDAEKRYILKE